MDKTTTQMLKRFRWMKFEFDKINAEKENYFEQTWSDILKFLRNKPSLPIGYDRLLRIKKLEHYNGRFGEYITMNVIRTRDDLYHLSLDSVEVYRKSVHIRVYNSARGVSGVIYLPFKYFDRFSAEYISKKFKYELKLQEATKDREKGETKTSELIREYKQFLKLKEKFENKKYEHFVKRYNKGES